MANDGAEISHTFRRFFVFFFSADTFAVIYRDEADASLVICSLGIDFLLVGIIGGAVRTRERGQKKRNKIIICISLSLIRSSETMC